MADRGGRAQFAQPREARFVALYRGHYREVRDYCRRRVQENVLDDVVAETFLTAWRRLDDIPEGVRARFWLYCVAYRVIGHQWRSESRRRRLAERVRSTARGAGPDGETTDGTAGNDLVLDAVARLNATDAEVLRLAIWEQLSVGDIATVLDIAPNAVKQRLHRARHNLGREYRRLASRTAPVAQTGGTR
jgi:RNA polymerase sigma factor (sigma-70 family)